MINSQFVRSNLSIICWNLTRFSSLIKPSASIWLVGMNITLTSPFSMNSRIAWYRTWICLVREWKTRLTDRSIKSWLSAYMIVAFFLYTLDFHRVYRRCHNQTACFPASVNAIYSDSVVDWAVIDCRLLIQLTGAPLIKKQNPVMNQNSLAFT